MAALHGKGGQLAWKTKNIYRITGWNLSVDTPTADVTCFSTNINVWRSFIPTLNAWSGSISGFWDPIGDSSGQKAIQTGLLAQSTGSIILKLNDTGGENFAGAVYWTGGQFAVAVDAVESVTLNFQGNGALTYATA